jgi:membrane protease YdiL (CAAX protease family)
MEAERITLKALGAASAGIVLLEGIARWAIARGAASPMEATLLVRLADIVLLSVLVSVCGLRWGALGLARGGWERGMRRGVIWSAGFGAAAAVGFLAAGLIGMDPLRLIRPAGGLRQGGLALYFLAGALVGPIAEELFFRGYLFGYFRRWGAPAAVISSTALFVLMHPAAGGIPVVQIAGGLLFAIAYEIEKNLLVPVVIHVLGNLALFALPLLPL